MREYDGNGMTGALLMRILRPYFYTGRYLYVEGDLQPAEGGSVQLCSHKKMEVLAEGVPGEAMQSFFEIDRVDVGDCHAFQGVMEGKTYNLWGMKEPDYVMRMMAMQTNHAGWPVVVGTMGGSRFIGRFNINACLTGIFCIEMRWTSTTTCSMDCLPSRTVGEPNGGRFVFLIHPRHH